MTPATSPGLDGRVCRPAGVLGIALSGGGARALAQLGVLKVLDREGVQVSYVTGTSAGAIIGALYVTSRDAQEAEDRILAHLQTTGTGFNIATFAALGPARASAGRLVEAARLAWRAVQPGSSVVPSGPVRASLRSLLGDLCFRDTRRPFATTALDLVSGRRLIFAEGSLADAAYASSAIPGLFEPLELDGHVLVDGGWAEPVPVETCHHLGAIHIIAVDVPNPEPYGIGGHAVSTALRADALARDLLEEACLRQADLVVRVRARVQHFADFSDPGGLIAAGVHAAEESLDAICAVLERHRTLFVRAQKATPATHPAEEAREEQHAASD